MRECVGAAVCGVDLILELVAPCLVLPVEVGLVFGLVSSFLLLCSQVFALSLTLVLLFVLFAGIESIDDQLDNGKERRSKRGYELLEENIDDEGL